MSRCTKKITPYVLKQSIKPQVTIAKPSTSQKRASHYFYPQQNPHYSSNYTHSESKSRKKVNQNMTLTITPRSISKISCNPDNTLATPFRSALKTRPTTCSPLKRVKFDLESQNLALFSHKTHWKQLFSSLKSNIEKRLQISSNSSPAKRSYLGVNQIRTFNE